MTTESHQPVPDVFLSYASADREQALHIADLLEAHGVAVWVDRRSIGGGTSWSAEIVTGIEGSSVLVLLCSAATMASPNVQQEVQLAWDSRRPILPLLLEPVRPPQAMRYALAGRQWIEILDRPENAWLPIVLQALRRLGLTASEVPLPVGRPAPRSQGVASTLPVAPPHNLPVQVTSFVGREKELDQIKRLLATTHLLTVTGVGGGGKTRLAIQAAAEMLDGYPDGVWFVELASLAQSELVPGTVARAVGIREEPGQSVLSTLTSALSSRRLLLLLDNCEHLIDACARLADTLMHSCPNVRILATSREALNIQGETTLQVPPLALAHPNHLPPFENLMQYEAMRLFVDRATSVQPSFALTDENAPFVARICDELDGIPLAIELAAAQVRVLSLEQIAARLGDRFRLLKGGSRTALPRQQTLRGLVDWSYDLLSENEKRLLGRLSLFVGGWTLGAAEAVCAADLIASGEVLELLTELVDKSLVQAEAPSAGEVRYRLLQTLREYAAEKLREDGEPAILGRRHAEYFRDVAERLSERVHGPDQVAVYAGLQREVNNFRAAITFALHAWPGPDGAESARRIIAALDWFWAVRGYWREAIDLCEQVLALPDTEQSPSWSRVTQCAVQAAWLADDYARARQKVAQLMHYADEHDDRPARALALVGLALADLRQGEYGAAQSRAAEAFALANTPGVTIAPWHRVVILQVNGHASLFQGRAVEAEPWYARALESARQQQDPRGIALCLYYLGLTAMYAGQLQRASSHFAEGVELFRQIGEPRHIADILAKQAALARHAGDLDRAHELGQRALLTRDEIGDRRGIAECLTACAGLARASGKHPEFAIRLLAAAEALRSSIGATVPGPERRDAEQTLDWARSALAGDAFTATWEAGRSMGPEAAVRLALGFVGR